MMFDRLVIRPLRHMIAGGATAPNWRDHEAMYWKATMLVSAFYAVTAAQLYGAALNTSRLTVEEIMAWDRLWPLFWADGRGAELAPQALTYLFLAAGIAGLLFWRHPLARILVSAAVLMQAAVANTHGGALSHGVHEWFWVSVCMWFLPRGPATDRHGRIAFLYAFGMAPAVILFFYSMSGVYKVAYALLAFFEGEVGGFAPQAMAVTLARRAVVAGADPLWADVVINNPLVGWPLYMFLYYVEVVALIVLFRPALIPVWGVILILFHFGTLLFMGIVFSSHVILNGLFLVLYPQPRGGFDLRRALMETPGFGGLFGRVSGRGARRATKS